MARQLRKCFIAAPAVVDTGPLRRALTDRGIEFSEPDRSWASLLLPDAIDQAISASDFVCIVLAEDYRSPNIWFEAGLAQAKRIPILVFAESDVQPPVTANTWSWVKAPLTNRNALELHLDAFLRRTRTSKRSAAKRNKKERRSGVDVGWASVELERVRNLRPMADRASALEQLVARLFESAGLSVVKSPHEHEQHVDLALWVDELQLSVLNPLYVEIKMGDLSQEQLQQAEERLRSFISSSRGGAGLLAYLDTGGREFTKQTKQSFPVVVWKNLPELIKEIETGGFVRSLQSERNRAAHL